jgi:tetratricopeptide (TPR) repeat protein
VAFRRAVSLGECGVHRVLQGDLRGAREALEESVAIDPRGPQAPAAQVWLGEVGLLEGRPDAAERSYRSAMVLGPPGDLSAHAATGLASVLLQRGDLGGAERLLAQALTGVPPQPLALHARFLQGVERLLAGAPGEALALWDTVEASGAPDSVRFELAFWRGIALTRLDREDQGAASLERFVASAPTAYPLRVDAIVQLGWLALERGAPTEAARRFLLADGAGPRLELRPQLRVGLLRAYLALGDTLRAGEVGRRLEIESPRDPIVAPALLLIADEAGRRGSLLEALQVYRRLLTLPLEPAIHDYVLYRFGEALEQVNQLAEARERYRTLRDRGREEAIAQRGAYRLGLLELRQGDVVGARREGEALLRGGTIAALREPAVLLAAEAAARGGDPNRAAALFRVALRENPDSPLAAPVRLRLGWALHQDRESESALREWAEVARSADAETATGAWLAMAEVSLAEGRDAEALSALRGVGPLPAGSPLASLADVVSLDRGILAVRTGAWQEAVQTLEPLAPRLVDFPRQALLRRALGLARFRLGQFDLAERQFRQAAHVAPAEPSSWLGVGLAALAQSRLAEAQDALNRARLAAVPELSTAATYGLVLTALRRGDTDQFRERATAFVDRYPTYPATPAVLYALVAAALDRGDLDAGEAWVRRLVRDQPQSDYVPDALLRLAAATADKRPQVARQAYLDLLALRPGGAGRTDAWLGIAEAAIALGDPRGAQQAAEGFLREAPPSDPRVAEGYVLLARAHQMQGQREQALRATDAFLARSGDDPRVPAVQLTRGQLLVESGAWEPAQRAFEAARDRGEPAVAAPAQFWLGETLRARDQHDAAISEYLGATYLYPDSPWAARGLQGAAQSYLGRNMAREAGIVLRKLLTLRSVEPALAQWARQVLGQLGPTAGPNAAPRR